MPLKLYPRPNGVFHIRGTVQGVRYDFSARTRNRSEAEAIRAKTEADAFKRAVYGAPAVATFAEAVIGYIKAGGDPEHLTPLLAKIGERKLSEINQAAVDDLAANRSVKPSTLIRQIYTPVLAVMNFAAEQGLCGKPAIRKPKVRTTRTDYLTPDQAEAWIAILPPHLRRLFVFYLSTGCRATEALELQWADVSPEAERVVFWRTKADYPRGVDLGKRARGALPERSEGPVFLNSRGEPWHGYDAINLMLRRIKAREDDKEDGARLAPVHCHLLRHTWATWAYTATRDLTFVMQSGGWRSLSILGRYTHAASPDLARLVLAKGWEFGGREQRLQPPKGRKR